MGNIPTQDITLDSLNVLLPGGLPEGQYVISINQNDVEVAYAWLIINTAFMQSNPNWIMSDNPQPQTVKLIPAFDGKAPWTTKDLLSYRLYKQNEDDPDDYEDTGITGAVEHLSGYALTMQIPKGMDEGYYEIAIEKNGLKIATTYLTAQKGDRRVEVGTSVGFKSSTVKVPVYGVYAQGASGIQFQLNFNPELLSVVGEPDTDEWNITTTMKDTICSATVDNKNGVIYVVLAAKGEITDNIVKLCEIEFAVSNNANEFLPIYIYPLDNSLLSDGFNEIDAATIPGGVQLLQRGDVNGNERIDVGDAILLLRHCAGSNTLSEDRQKIGDVDGTGKVELADAIYVLEKVVQKITAFPAEPATPEVTLK
jgi:hypothetical protein